MTEPLHPDIVVKSRQSWQILASSVFRSDVEKALRTDSFDSVADQFMNDSESAKDNLVELIEIAKKYVTVVGKLPKPPKQRNSSSLSESTLEAFSPPNAKDLIGASQNNYEEAISTLPADAVAAFRLHTELFNDAHPFIRVNDKSTLAIFFTLETSQIGTTSTSRGSSKTELQDRGTRDPSVRNTWNESTTTRPEFRTIRNWFVAFVDSEHLIFLTTNGSLNHDGTSEITGRIAVPRSEIHSIQWGYEDASDLLGDLADRLLGWFNTKGWVKTHQRWSQMIENYNKYPSWNFERVINININFGESRIASPMLEAAEQLAVSLRSDRPRDSTA